MEKEYDWYDAGTIEVKKKSEALTIVNAIDFFALLMSKFPGEQFIKYKRNFTPYPQIGDRIQALRNYILDNDAWEIAHKVVDRPDYNELVASFSAYLKVADKHGDSEMKDQMTKCIRFLSEIQKIYLEHKRVKPTGVMPAFMNDPKGIEILKEAVKAGYLNDDFTLKRKPEDLSKIVMTRGQIKMFVLCICYVLKEDNQWAQFERWWGIKNLRQKEEIGKDRAEAILKLFPDNVRKEYQANLQYEM